MEIREIVAQSQTNCGDGSTMGLRFLIALGLIEQSRMDDFQDELTNDVALELAYEAIDDALTALREHGLVIVPRKLSDKMFFKFDSALRDPSFADPVENARYIWQAILSEDRDK